MISVCVFVLLTVSVTDVELKKKIDEWKKTKRTTSATSAAPKPSPMDVDHH